MSNCTKAHRYELAICPMCKLEEKDKRIAELEAAIKYAQKYCDRETFDVLEAALEGEK